MLNVHEIAAFREAAQRLTVLGARVQEGSGSPDSAASELVAELDALAAAQDGLGALADRIRAKGAASAETVLEVAKLLRVTADEEEQLWMQFQAGQGF